MDVRERPAHRGGWHVVVHPVAGTLPGIITDPDMDGVASGALFGNSLYVNNALYSDLPTPGTECWITTLSIYDVQS